MMPGSLIDKTNNNLTNLTCAHSTIGQKTDPEKENLTNMDETKQEALNNSDIMCKETLSSNVPESTDLNSENHIENKQINSTNKRPVKNVKSNKERKILCFLKKYNVNEKDLISKLKYFKRQAKDKKKPNCVLSSKLKRYHFNNKKLNRYHRKNDKKKNQLTNKYLIKQSKSKQKVKTCKIIKNNSNGTVTNNIQEDENNIHSIEQYIPNFKADDDIRNKIKKQLELLRQNKKPITKTVENTSDHFEREEGVIDTKTTKDGSEDIPKEIDLNEVLLNQEESGISIISVVGGYISEESCQEIVTEKFISSDIEELQKSVCNKQNHLVKGISMTDILLNRELNQENSTDSHIITPTKTNDIRKIKGWRTKHFTVATSTELTENKLSTKEDQEEETENKDIATQKKEMEIKLCKNSIENPFPSTSFGYFEPELKAQTTTSVKTDNILKQGENTNLEKNTKSAFISDMLDTFLTNHAELKISYEVPKLVAEEAITKPLSEMPVGNNDYLTVVKRSYKRKNPNTSVFKPKTLAEKRRMLEQDRQNQLLQDMETNENIYLKQLEHCEKRDESEIAKEIRENLITKNAPFSRHCWDLATKFDEDARQFVIVNGHKIRILGSSGGKNLIVNNKENNYSKFNHRLHSVTYKPGPLSRKHKLIKIHNSDNWECRVLKMPKIKLIVYPEQGKQLPPLAEQYLQLHRGKSGYISDELAKFAVSAVRSEENTKTSFEFDIPYHNGQNKLLVRKQVYRNTSHDRKLDNIKTEVSTPIEICKNEFSNIDVEDNIKEIMSKMLNCIENQELDKLIIKNDPDLNILSWKKDKYVERPPSPINPMVQAIIKRPNAKRSKTTLELRRLNVQVIEVDVKEEENEAETCMKDFCKLGCICKSLRGATALVPEHCGRETCMLECSCTFGNSQRSHHSITLPAGTDLLSASTVVRLQDEVKRKLAKEEREFAQTVIKANNQTIMVGSGARERQRRVPKVPKKYSNYIQKTKGLSYDKMISKGLLEDDDDYEAQLTKYELQRFKEEEKKQIDQRVVAVELRKPIPIWNKKDKKPHSILNKKCRVNLTKLNLENVIPWCMVHNLYQCHCGGNAIFEVPTKPKVIDQINASNGEDGVEYIAYAPRNQARLIIPENNTSVTVTDISEKYCARTRALASNYYQARNKSQSFKARYAKMKANEDKQKINLNNIIEESVSIESTKYSVIATNDAENKRLLGEIEIKDDTNLYDNKDLLVSKQNKNFTIVNLEDILNPQKKEVQPQQKSPNHNPCQIVSAASFIDYDRSYIGILTPSSEWLDRFHKMLNLNLNTVIRQIRLLEWATLVERHKTGTLQLWFNNKKYNNIILTEDRKRPTRFHVNVKMFEKTSLTNFRLPEIITSLFQKKLPGVARRGDETYVILVYNGMFWEARGTIVLNDTSKMCKERLGHKPTPCSILSTQLHTSQNSNLVIRSTPAMSVEIINNNFSSSSPNVQTDENTPLEITKVPITTETQNVEKHNAPVGKRKKTLLAPLPTGFGLSRWFMLILKSDFSVLRISFSNFHIKYTHLITAIETAKKNMKTVRIRSQEKNDSQNSFGVYAIPNFSDRIFFGPYNNEADHGLETFRYVNGKLVNTKIYNKMRGSVERNTTGIWYFHNSTIHNNLILEQQEDNVSSGSDCSTEMTTAEKAVKPQIEFVDLTENDSDNEIDQKSPVSNVDPLFNVLAADFTKKVSGDITIEPVFENATKSSASSEIKKCDAIIQTNNDSAKLTSLPASQPVDSIRKINEKEQKVIRKRKSVANLSQPPKKQPTLIDSIDLADEDDSLSQLENSVVKNQSNVDLNALLEMPEICPLNNINKLYNEALKRKRKVLYVITNIPGIGYFEIFLTNKKCMQLNINGKATMFSTINMAIAWLHQLFRNRIVFMPANLKVNFSILESAEVPEMSKFNENFLNGSHVICEKGIFDLMHTSTDDMTKQLCFNEQEISTCLAFKCELLVNKNVRILGNYLVGPEDAVKLDRARILLIAPKQIKVLESRETFLIEQKEKLKRLQSELVAKINILVKDLPEKVKTMTRDQLNKILQTSVNRTKNNIVEKPDEVKTNTARGTVNSLPSGKVRKIVQGKVVLTDALATPNRGVVTKKSQVVFKNQGTVVQPYPVKMITAKSLSIMQSVAEKSHKPYEMIVPIAGLQSPVTVVGIPSQVQSPTTSLLLSNHKKSPQPPKIVDLTDD